MQTKAVHASLSQELKRNLEPLLLTPSFTIAPPGYTCRWAGKGMKQKPVLHRKDAESIRQFSSKLLAPTEGGQKTLCVYICVYGYINYVYTRGAGSAISPRKPLRHSTNVGEGCMHSRCASQGAWPVAERRGRVIWKLAQNTKGGVSINLDSLTPRYPR